MLEEWFVRSVDGVNYAVGTYAEGEWCPGNQQDATREYAGLDEPGSWIWGRSVRTRSRDGRTDHA